MTDYYYSYYYCFINIIISIDWEYVSGMGGMLVCCCLQPCRLERPFRGKGWVVYPLRFSKQVI